MTVSSVGASSTSSMPIGGSAVQIMAAVEMMIVQEYDNQLLDMAKNMKRNTKMKQAMRQHIAKLNELTGKSADKNGKVKLSASERSLLESKPNFSWNANKHGGIGGADVNYTGGSSWFGGKVSKEKIQAEIERLQMKVDDLNSDSEQIQTELSRISNERKLCFDTLAKMLNRYYESASNLTRSI